MSCGTKDGQHHIYTPLQAMRHKCLDCCCGSNHEVELCPVKDCSLYPYRRGKHPTRKGTQPKGQIPQDSKNLWLTEDGREFQMSETNGKGQGREAAEKVPGCLPGE